MELQKLIWNCQRIRRYRVFTCFFILFGTINIHAQNQTKFNDLIEMADDGKMKIFLSDVFQITYKTCADYYMLVDLDDSLFYIKDSIKVFYKDDKLFLKGKYVVGKRQGQYTIYHKNGEIKQLSQYDNGMPVGTWKFYFDNGNINKIISFSNGGAFLSELYKRNGKALVQDGFGKYEDSMSISKFLKGPYKVQGAIKNGLPDGKWKISSDGYPYATEFFEAGYFEKGISHSRVIGDSEYYENPLSTFLEFQQIENLNISSAQRCYDKYDLGLSKKFNEKLKRIYEKSDLQSELTNRWFLCEIKADDEGKITNVEIISEADQHTIDQLKKMIFSVKYTYSVVKPYSGYKYFPLIIYQSNIYLRKEMGNKLIN